MTPGIQPSKVKIRLKKKLAIRPVINTASGGSTMQKKYRSAFIANSSSSAFPFLIARWTLGVGRSAFSDFWLLASDLRLLIVAARNLRSPDSTANRDKDDATAIQARRFVPQHRSPCISRS